MIHVREFWVLVGITVIGALALARTIQFFAMGCDGKLVRNKLMEVLPGERKERVLDTLLLLPRIDRRILFVETRSA